MSSPCVIGLDLSLTASGIASYCEDYEWHTDRAQSKGRKADTLLDRANRLSRLSGQIALYVSDRDPELVVVESPSYGSLHGSAHDRSGLWWLVMNDLHSMELAVATVAPQGRAKYATGKGNAKKDVVKECARAIYPTADIPDDNVADAVILAAMGSRHLGYPLEGCITDKQLEAMAGAAWPT